MTRRLAILAAVLLTGCSASITAADEPPGGNRDPRRGRVQVWSDSGADKRCDGTTLVYISSGGNLAGVVPASPECAP